MQAVILAAGVGRRMKNLSDEKGDLPKCLLKVGEQTLLERHILTIAALGIKKINMIVGYRHDDVEASGNAYVEKHNLDMKMVYTMNDRFEEGSLLSMYLAGQVMANEHSLLMDADVLYPRQLLQKLVESDNANCFLLDQSAGASDEEMRLGAENGRIITIKRGLPGGFPIIGEGVGFLKISANDSSLLMNSAKDLIDKGQIGDYEEAINNFLAGTKVGYELVEEPWMEIDFEEDVVRAREEILPAIHEMEA